MRLSYFFGFILLTMFSCSNSKNSVGLEKNKIKELGIQYQKIYEYLPKFGEPDENSKFFVELIEFNKDGNPIRKESYHRSEYLKDYEEIELYTYDSGNNVIEVKTSNPEGSLKLITKNKYQGKLLVERCFYNSDGELRSKTIYKYDNKENMIEYISYDNKGVINSKNLFSYDGDRVIGTKEYDNNGKLERTTKTIHVGKTDFETQIFNSEGKQEYVLNEYFDDKKRRIAVEYYEVSETNPERIEYTYDSNDLLMEINDKESNGEYSKYKKVEYITFE